jgi:integrase
LAVAAESDPVLHAVVALTLGRGLRRGEALGLLKSHLDFDNEVIHIQQRIREERLRTRDGAYITELLTAPPKTFKSRRDLTLTGEVAKALKRVLLQQKKDRFAAGEAWHVSDHVFTTKLGKPLYPSNVSKRLKKLLKENGLPEVGAHALRHTWTVLSIEAGVRVEEAQEALGHESIETTKNIYAHSVKGLAKRAFDTFDESMVVKTRFTGLPHTAHNHER